MRKGRRRKWWWWNGVWSLLVLLIMFRLELGRPIPFWVSFLSGYMAHRYPVPGRIRSLIPGCRVRERKSVVPEEGGLPKPLYPTSIGLSGTLDTPSTPSSPQPTRTIYSPGGPTSTSTHTFHHHHISSLCMNWSMFLILFPSLPCFLLDEREKRIQSIQSSHDINTLLSPQSLLTSEMLSARVKSEFPSTV
jgi:hypothetical protein